MLATAGVSLPTFFTGLLLIYVFYYLLGWAPSPLGRLDVFVLPPTDVTGFYLVDSLLAGDLETFLARAARNWFCPRVTLGLFVAGAADRAHDARARCSACCPSTSSAPRGRAACRAGRCCTPTRFRNALLPVVTTLGMVFSFLLGANVLVEKVFAWPGIGSYAIEALVASDYAPVQGFVLTMAMLFVALNLAIDMLYGLIDPRVGIDG